MKTLPKFIFIHIVKTGGTSFRKNFLNEVYKDRHVVDNIYKSKLGRPKKGEERNLNREWIPIINLNVTKKVKIHENTNVIYGHFRHFKYAELNWPYVTFVRDPVERIISAYFYYRMLFKDNIGIRDFAKIFPNHMTYVLGNNFNKYKFIGITEKFDDSLVRFCKVFNIPWMKQVTPRQRDNKKFKENVSLKDKNYIRSLNEKDYILYNKALKIHKRMR